MANMNLGHTENKNPVNLDEWVKNYVSDAQIDVKELKDKVDRMWDYMYPVGSIYFSMIGKNPAETLGGGTWVLWGSGRVPVCVNTGDPDFGTPGKTGGEKKHTLTINEMPNHRHGVDNRTTNQTASKTDGYIMRGSYNGNSVASDTSYVGGGQAHNIMQPYITCYMWHRTA